MSYEADDSVTKSVGQDKLPKELCDEANTEFAETDLVSAAADNLTTAVKVDFDIQLPNPNGGRSADESTKSEPFKLGAAASKQEFVPKQEEYSRASGTMPELIVRGRSAQESCGNAHGWAPTSRSSLCWRRSSMTQPSPMLCS